MAPSRQDVDPGFGAPTGPSMVERMQALFSEVDANGDSRLDRTELLALASRIGDLGEQ